MVTTKKQKIIKSKDLLNVRKGKSIYIIVEDTKKKRYCKIPLTQDQASALWEMQWFLCDDCIKDLERNSADTHTFKAINKFTQVMDALDEGRCAEMSSDKKHFIESKFKCWYGDKRPKWMKIV